MVRLVFSSRNILAAITAVALTACADVPTIEQSVPGASADSRAAAEAPLYEVTDLGTLGGGFSIAFGVNDAGHVGGGANTGDEVSHVSLWRDGRIYDAGSLGGNANAAINARDELAGLSETAAQDPNNEDFCGFGTNRICAAVFTNHGVLEALPTLGGLNASGANLNNRGQIVGFAETSLRDETCSAGTPSQRFRYEPVLWNPAKNEVLALPTLPGDDVGFAIGLNDHDQVVGSTGSCATTLIKGRMVGPHAVLWDHGRAIALDPSGAQSAISVAAAINDAGQVAGGSGTAAVHSFVWTRGTGKRDIGTVDGDLGSFATGINERGDVVGISCVNDALCDTANPELVSRAYLWRNGKMNDLNALLAGDSPLILLAAFGINESGQVVGLAFNFEVGEAHAFLATPVQGRGPDASRAIRTSRVPGLSRSAGALLSYKRAARAR